MPAERLALAIGRNLSGNASRLPFHRLGLARNNKATFPARWPELWDLYVAENGLTPIASLTHRLDLLDRLDLRSILPEIGQEVLVVHGTADRIVPPSCHRELVAGLANPTPSLMVGVGHQPHWTHPEALARRVSDFFDAGRPDGA
jgi:pimeloyl-ACP methyl ester carboxylesterase